MNSIDNIINSIGLKIKYYRNLKNISLSKLAKEANISKSTLFGLEEGRSNPTISTLVSLSKTLNIELSELIDSALDGKKNSTNLTLIDEDSKSSKSIYKIVLLPNEYIELNFSIYDSVELEMLSGSILDIKSQKIATQNSKIEVEYCAKLKALNGGATAIVEVKEFKSPIYFSNDLFFNKPTNQILNSLIDIAKSTKIVRAIFRTIYPVEFPKVLNYTQIVEATYEKESHYYIYRVLFGLVTGVTNISKEIEGLDSLVSKKIDLIKKATSNQALSIDELLEFKTHPILELYSDITNSIKQNYKDVTILSNAKELDIVSNSKYILVIDELANSANSYSELKNLTLATNIYRALEMLLPIKERELPSNELEVLNSFKYNLPKAFYFAKLNSTKIAVDTIRAILKSIDLKDIQESKLSNYFTTLYNYLDSLLQNIESSNLLTTKDYFENRAKELNLEFIIKENLHPFENGAGKFLYLLKRE